jgi:hypothetical protein
VGFRGPRRRRATPLRTGLTRGVVYAVAGSSMSALREVGRRPVGGVRRPSRRLQVVKCNYSLTASKIPLTVAVSVFELLDQHWRRLGVVWGRAMTGDNDVRKLSVRSVAD